MACDDRKLRSQFVIEKKDLLHAQLMKRIRLHEDITSLTAHEFAQPLGALRLELDHLLAGLKRGRHDEQTQNAIKELQPILATMDHLIAERREQQQSIDEDSIDAVDLRGVIEDVERFYRHRFQANGREIRFFSDVDQAVVFANHRVLLHIILEVVSFLDQQIDDQAMNFNKTLHLALTETLSGWFSLTFHLKRRTLIDFIESEIEAPSTLSLLTECCSELLGSYGIVVTSRFTLKGQRLVFTLPRHDLNEFSQLHTLASDIRPRIDTWLPVNE